LKSIWDQRQSLLWWTGGTAMLSALIMILFPYIDVGEELETLFEQMPPVVQAMIGEEFDLTTVAGYLDIRMFATFAPIIFLVYAIGRGNAAISGEEKRGTMDLLLANPVRRWRLVIENAAAMLFGLLVIGLAIWVGLVTGALIMDIEWAALRGGQATLMGVLLGMVFGSLSLLIGGATGKTGLSIGVSAAIAIATYFLHSLAPLVDWLEPYRVLSPFYYYIGHSVMLDGFRASYALTMAAIALVLIILAVVAFQRRDVQV
jgi:ABC-2 type transport system permease protein